MKLKTHQLLLSVKRPVYVLAAVLMAAGSCIGVAEAQTAAGGGQVQYREVKMSDNGASGNSTIPSGVGSGTNVTYRVSFTAASSYNIKGLVLDFCSGQGTPFTGDATCPAPSGFSVGGSNPTVDTSAYDDNTTGNDPSATTNQVHYNALDSTSNWTTGSLYSNQTFYMTNTTGFNVSAGQKYSFAISGITNPDTTQLGTFFARLVTFKTTAGASGYTHGFTTAYQDYGGFALSTANVVQVTAKVQESLTFCVSGQKSTDQTTGLPTGGTPFDNANTLGCGASTIPAIILGHGTNNTLDTSRVDTNSVYTLASTNALHGLTIRMRNSNGTGSATCGGLSIDGGTTCAIPPVSSGSSAAAKITAGQAAFGMLCNPGTLMNTDSRGGTNCDTNYYNSAHATSGDTYYGMDSSTLNDNVTTLYGDRVAYSTEPIATVTNEFDFAATASNTTPAGIYTANMAMIATGSF